MLADMVDGISERMVEGRRSRRRRLGAVSERTQQDRGAAERLMSDIAARRLERSGTAAERRQAARRHQADSFAAGAGRRAATLEGVRSRAAQVVAQEHESRAASRASLASAAREAR